MAVDPPEDLRRAIAGLPRPDRPGVRWTTAAQWHITLAFIARVDPEALVSALELSLQHRDPVTAEAGPSPARLSHHVWVLPVRGLESLAGDVNGALSDFLSEDPEARPFTGHLTLARSRDRRGLVGLPAPPLEWRWPVREVVAYRSHLRPEGAIYEVLGRWPLPR